MSTPLTNPIIQRELIGMLRTRKAIAMILALVAGLATLVLLRWPSDSMVELSGGQALQVLRVFGYGTTVGLLLLAPIFPATSIVKERQSGTLALLLNSPMSSWDLLIGKLVGSLGFLMICLTMTLPAAAACFAMGGIDPISQIGGLYLILILLSIECACLGLLISSYVGTTEAALRITYASVLIMTVVTLGPHQFLQNIVTGQLLVVIDWVRCISPIPAITQTLGDSAVSTEGARDSAGATMRFAILSLTASVAMLLWTSRRLHQRMLDRPRAAGKVTDDRSASARAYRRIMYLWFFDPQRRSGLIGPLTNPMKVKEQRCRRFGRGHWMMRLIGGVLIVSLALMLVTANQATQQAESMGRLGGVLVLLQVSLVILITPSLASGLISVERESGGWELLQMTPMSAFSIVYGKLMSVVQTLALVLAATLPGYVVLIAINNAYTQTVLQVLVCLLLTAVLALFVSAAVSSCCKRTAVATTVSYSILITLCGGTMLIWLGQGAPFGPGLVEAALAINPLAAALSIIGAPGLDEFNLVPTNWYVMGIFSAIALIVLWLQTLRLTRPR